MTKLRNALFYRGLWSFMEKKWRNKKDIRVFVGCLLIIYEKFWRTVGIL